jgi:hypothetical protein
LWNASLPKALNECVRRAVRALEQAMLGYLDQRNEDPKPFVSTASADMTSARSTGFVNASNSGH